MTALCIGIFVFNLILVMALSLYLWPISLLPIKVFERLLMQKIHADHEFLTLLPKHQFGFREDHSATRQVNWIVNEISKSLEEKNLSRCIPGHLPSVQQSLTQRLALQIKNCITYQLLKSYLSKKHFLSNLIISSPTFILSTPVFREAVLLGRWLSYFIQPIYLKPKAPQLLPLLKTRRYSSLHIQTKKELEIKFRQTLSNKISLYKTVHKPIWTDGFHLWDCAKPTSLNLI